MKRHTLRPIGRRGAALLAALVVGSAGLVTSAPAFAAISATADASYGYVVKVNVGGNRGCTGVLVGSDLVATWRECFQVGSTSLVSGPPPVASTVTPRPDQANTTTMAVNYLYVRDDRNLVLARIESGLGTPATVATKAPVAGETLRVLGYG